MVYTNLFVYLLLSTKFSLFELITKRSLDFSSLYYPKLRIQNSTGIKWIHGLAVFLLSALITIGCILIINNSWGDFKILKSFNFVHFIPLFLSTAFGAIQIVSSILIRISDSECYVEETQREIFGRGVDDKIFGICNILWIFGWGKIVPSLIGTGCVLALVSIKGKDDYIKICLILFLEFFGFLVNMVEKKIQKGRKCKTKSFSFLERLIVLNTAEGICLLIIDDTLLIFAAFCLIFLIKNLNGMSLLNKFKSKKVKKKKVLTIEEENEKRPKQIKNNKIQPVEDIRVENIVDDEEKGKQFTKLQFQGFKEKKMQKTGTFSTKDSINSPHSKWSLKSEKPMQKKSTFVKFQDYYPNISKESNSDLEKNKKKPNSKLKEQILEMRKNNSLKQMKVNKFHEKRLMMSSFARFNTPNPMKTTHKKKVASSKEVVLGKPSKGILKRKPLTEIENEKKIKKEKNEKLPQLKLDKKVKFYIGGEELSTGAGNLNIKFKSVKGEKCFKNHNEPETIKNSQFCVEIIFSYQIKIGIYLTFCILALTSFMFDASKNGSEGNNSFWNFITELIFFSLLGLIDLIYYLTAKKEFQTEKLSLFFKRFNDEMQKFVLCCLILWGSVYYHCSSMVN